MATINQLLVLMKIVRERMNDLKQLRTQLSTKETWYGTKDRIVEPQYDVRIVDKKITELQNFLYLADAKIKESNAITKVDIEIDEKELLKSIE